MRPRPPWCTALGALALAALAAAPARAAEPVALAGSRWRGTALARAKGVPGAPPARVIAFTLAFGPQADPPLSASDFRLLLTDGGAELPIGGVYALDAKGQPLLTPDQPALAAALATAVLESCGALEDPSGCAALAALEVTAAPPKLKLKARAKGGVETLHAAGKLEFELAEPGAAKPSAKLAVSFHAGTGSRD